MNGRVWSVMLAAGFALLISGIWLPAGVEAQGGPILRLAADFKNFDGTETFTMVGVDPVAKLDGISVFKKSVFVPAGVNTLYVTISATGDTHDGAAMWMTCRVNGVPCNPGFGGAAGAPAGWIAMQKHKNWIGLAGFLFGDGGGGGGDAHDNIIYYTWCTKTRDLVGGPATVEIRMGSSGPTRPDETGGLFPPTVFFEAAHFYIDASRITGSNQCTPAPPVEG